MFGENPRLGGPPPHKGSYTIVSSEPYMITNMGATPDEYGCSFRVWAPHANRVCVVGTFNNWGEWKSDLYAGNSGIWYGHVPSAKVGDEYKYLLRTERGDLLKSDPYARTVTKKTRNAVICSSWAKHIPVPHHPSAHERVIYELHVGTFAPRDGSRPGQLHHVIDKLPYLRDLGINTIEIMPIADFAGDYSWGYNPAFPYAVSETYGGRSALRKLIEAAHSSGLEVIVDVVYNHFGPNDLDLWRFDGWYENDGGGIYFYNDERAVTPWAHTRPDFRREEIRQYILENALMWLEEYGIDGLRWDATAYIRNVLGRDDLPAEDIKEGWSLIQQVNNAIKRLHPTKISIAEDLQDNPRLTDRTTSGGAGFDAQWEARLGCALREVVSSDVVSEESIDELCRSIEVSPERAYRRVLYTESHDEAGGAGGRFQQVIHQWENDYPTARMRAAQATAVMFTSPGIPMIFQGQEFAEQVAFSDTRALDWSKLKQNGGTVTLLKDLLALRRNDHNNTRGLSGDYVKACESTRADRIAAFHRWSIGGPGDDVIVVTNLSKQYHVQYELDFPSPGDWRVRLDTSSSRYNAGGPRKRPETRVVESVRNSSAETGFSGRVDIGPWCTLVLSQDGELP